MVLENAAVPTTTLRINRCLMHRVCSSRVGGGKSETEEKKKKKEERTVQSVGSSREVNMRRAILELILLRRPVECK
jgi:hypothetical protein